MHDEKLVMLYLLKIFARVNYSLFNHQTHCCGDM